MVEEATMKVTSSLRQNLTYVQQYQIEYVIAINIIRIRKRHLVELKPNWKNYLDLNNDFKSLTKIKAVFESLNIQKESEIYFFYLLMETRPKLYENKEVARRALEPHKKNNSDVYAATEVFIRVFSEEMAPIPQKKYDLFF